MKYYTFLYHKQKILNRHGRQSKLRKNDIYNNDDKSSLDVLNSTVDTWRYNQANIHCSKIKHLTIYTEKIRRTGRNDRHDRYRLP